MKKIASTIKRTNPIFILFLFLFSLAKAQSCFSIEAGLDMNFPTKVFKQYSGNGLGAYFALGYKLSENLSLTSSVSYISYESKDFNTGIFSYNAYPVSLGLKYYLLTDLFVISEVVLLNIKERVDIDLGMKGVGTSIINENIFGANFGLGYEYPISEKLKIAVTGKYSIVKDYENLDIRAGLKLDL